MEPATEICIGFHENARILSSVGQFYSTSSELQDRALSIVASIDGY